MPIAAPFNHPSNFADRASRARPARQIQKFTAGTRATATI